MKILIVANHNAGRFSPFVMEQVESLKKLGIDFDFFGIVGRGPIGYLKNLPALLLKIKEFQPDLIHAHYGLSGLLASLQGKVPVIVTYHGSDIHSGGMIQKLSKITMQRAAHNIIVSNHLKQMVGNVQNCSIIPCGVDTATFYPISKSDARRQLGWVNTKRYVLFAGAFDRAVKNPQLAKEVVEEVNTCELIELKGYGREEVNLLLNAADCVLMTSDNEGSPQIIKEALCCNTPVISVEVGDVAEVCDGVEGCYICERDKGKLAASVKAILKSEGTSNGRTMIDQKQLSLEDVALRVKDVYESIANLRCRNERD